MYFIELYSYSLWEVSAIILNGEKLDIYNFIRKNRIPIVENSKNFYMITNNKIRYCRDEAFDRYAFHNTITNTQRDTINNIVNSCYVNDHATVENHLVWDELTDFISSMNEKDIKSILKSFEIYEIEDKIDKSYSLEK